MQSFKKILYVSQGLLGEEDALAQALSTALHSKAQLKILILHPKVPNKLNDYKDFYTQSLMQVVDKMLQSVQASVGFTAQDLESYVTIDTESNDNHVYSIVKNVLKHNYDLVIQKARTNDNDTGLKSVDMNLLRKCPCPVWLCHPLKNHKQLRKIVVAIDPESPEKMGNDLAKNLLQTAAFLAQKLECQLDIISCWFYPFENSLAVPEAQIVEIVEEIRNEHFTLLKNIIDKADISCKYNIQHLKGLPAMKIPEYIKSQNIDLIIMGTIGRKWLDKFLMGNTAEDILHKLTCSLLAMKPSNFVSPID